MLRVFVSKTAQWLFPQLCRSCGLIIPAARMLCSDCDSKIKRTGPSYCNRCGVPYESDGDPHPCSSCIREFPPFHWHGSGVFYEGAIPNLLHRLKYQAALDLPDLFSEWLLKEKGSMMQEADFLIPVPVSLKRLKKRGYNQSGLIAKALAKKTGIPVLTHSLQKIRETLPQTHLSREERVHNLKGAFRWFGEEEIEGKKTILVDDVYSTGSTLAECARILLKRKPSQVGALTVAFNRMRS